MDTGVARIIGSSREVQAVAKDGTIVICDLRLNEIKVGDGSERFFVGSMLRCLASVPNAACV
jgi:hypothetical protein